MNIGWDRVRKMFSIGIPAAGESLAYQTSQIVMTSFKAIYGATVLATRVYTMNIMFYISVFGMSCGKLNISRWKSRRWEKKACVRPAVEGAVGLDSTTALE